jgi:uncharacterized protein YndB with AHSA1/START domain
MEAKLGDKTSLRIQRSYPVAPEKVWRAWTDAEALKRWWGAQPVAAVELDVRAGGRYRICFGGADGNANECAGVYKEVVPNRRLVFTWHWPRTTPERVSLITIEFRAAGTGTELDFRHEQFFDEQARDNHNRGWNAAFANLDKLLGA